MDFDVKVWVAKIKKPEVMAFWAVKYGVTVWCNAEKEKNMDSENKQRIILYFDKEAIEKMDYFIKQYGYRFRNDFVPSAVDSLIADKLPRENDTVSVKKSKAIAEMSEAQTLQIAKVCFVTLLKWNSSCVCFLKLQISLRAKLKICAEKLFAISAGQEEKYA